jgi:hypothetical protein
MSSWIIRHLHRPGMRALSSGRWKLIIPFPRDLLAAICLNSPLVMLSQLLITHAPCHGFGARNRSHAVCRAIELGIAEEAIPAIS